MTKHIRPIRVEGNIAYVPLTQGKEAVIDAADIPLISGQNWTLLPRHTSLYAVRRSKTGPAQTESMHRVIMGKPEGLQVDHIDGDGLNNRRSNLRLATHSENQWNRRSSASVTGRLKGVTFNKATRMWRAQIRVYGQKLYLGKFDTPEEAHAAYCAASARFHGEFGRTK